jgi:hypothetical protein
MRSELASPKPLGTVLGIAYGGLAVGILDALAATILTIVFGGNPVRTWQGVASGILRDAAFAGGIATMLFGLLCHFFIAYSVVTVYHLASKRLPTLWRRPLIWGPIYGVAVYWFMQLVVLELVFPDHRISALAPVIRGMLVHIVCVGTPAALFARKAMDGTFGFALRADAAKRSAEQHA